MIYIIENKEMNDLIVAVYEAAKAAQLEAVETLKSEMAATGVTYGRSGEVTGFVIPPGAHYDKDYFDKLTISVDGEWLDVITFLSPGLNKYKDRVKSSKSLLDVLEFFTDREVGRRAKVDIADGIITVDTHLALSYPFKRKA